MPSHSTPSSMTPTLMSAANLPASPQMHPAGKKVHL